LVFFVAYSSSAKPSEPKNILVLFSFRPTLPVASKWDRGIRSIFEAEPNLKADINIEYLDLSRFNDSNYIKMIFSVFRHKYFESKPDLIVAVYEPALDFLLRHQEDLFPGVPIVFGGVERVFIENQGNRPDITGVYQGNSFIKTLETALNLHPNTRHIRIFVGAGMLEQSWAMAAREAYVRYEDKYDFVYVPARSIEDLQKKVAELPPNTLILYLPIIKDRSGKTHFAIDVISRISEVSTAPIYGFWEVILGHGIVGGDLSSFEEQAKAVAKIGLRILKGARAADIPSIDTPGLRYMFDWQQLRRWSINEDRLPYGSTVMFKEFSTWEKYKIRIFGAVALIVFQALFIFYLLHQRRIKRKVEQNYKTVADYTYDWEYWQNTNGKMQYVSPSCERICGYPAQDFMDNPSLLRDIIVPEDRATWDEHRYSVQKEMKPEEIQFRIKRPDGEICWIEHACQPVFDHKVNYQGIRASNRDITKRELYKSETQKLQSELAHMDRVVTISALTSALAHEINQPLAAIRSYAQAALRFMDKDKPDFDNMRKALEGIVSDNKRAAAVINRLRDLVKKGTVHRDPLEINSVINDVVSLMNSELVLRNASIALDLNPDLPVVQGDSIQLQQVLINLLSNALDAMEDQPADTRFITISSRYENPDVILVSISDSGKGISPDKIDAVFNAFETTKAQGTGLGLAICKSIVEAHEGKIWAENRSDRGAIFSFSLPSSGPVD
jgi:PAS domain S-box-containing protein